MCVAYFHLLTGNIFNSVYWKSGCGGVVGGDENIERTKTKNWANFNEFPWQRRACASIQQPSVVRVLKMYLSFIEWLSFETIYFNYFMQIYLLVFSAMHIFIAFFFRCSLLPLLIARGERNDDNYHYIGCCFFFSFGFCYLHWTECLNDKTTATPAKILSVDGLNSNLLSLVDYYSCVQCRVRALREIWTVWESSAYSMTAWFYWGFFLHLFSQRLVWLLLLSLFHFDRTPWRLVKWLSTPSNG